MSDSKWVTQHAVKRVDRFELTVLCWGLSGPGWHWAVCKQLPGDLGHELVARGTAHSEKFAKLYAQRALERARRR